MQETTTEILYAARDLAIEKLSGESEPPWTWYRYMQLREACEKLIEGLPVTQENSQLLEKRLGSALRLVGSNNQTEKTPPHPDKITVLGDSPPCQPRLRVPF